MSDSNGFNIKEEPKASQAAKTDVDSCSNASNADQKSPQTTQSGAVDKEKLAKDKLEKDIAHHRSALIYGPENPNARFWAIRATSRRNRSLNRVNTEMRKTNGLRNTRSGEKFGKSSTEAQPLHPSVSETRQTSILSP
ncbi:hypothetical protein BOTCAL_0929g00010 [Botryotinia calthae]|uniref:Uncharacterized protein n=1 Tax=Botryotinia calthae TaxID=38488 RepID=A0A4Y8CES6_9HELO|nr:hypothetical protein BOTCAL_0929g00010 [Botryotinia calthae]